MTQDQHDNLAGLAWRYAAIIGIIDHQAIGITDEEIESDREELAPLIKVEDGMPCFDDLEAASYMAEISGRSVEECHEVLLEEWPAPADVKEC